jgi:hypothetical protein
VRCRLYRATRTASAVLLAGYTVFVATFLGGPALAAPPPPAPSPSVGPEPTVSSPAPSRSVGPEPTVSSPAPSGVPHEAPVGLQLALSPTQGSPGTSFRATVTNTEVCFSYRNRTLSAPRKISFEWPFGQQSVAADSVTFTVPEGATPRAYQVSASCAAAGNSSGSATFTVTPQPSLTLSPGQGTPGQTLVTATTKGFDACLGGGSNISQTVLWQWDDGPLLTSPGGADASTVTFEVPATAAASTEHAVTASCNGVSAKASFTVLPIATPALRLEKSQGPRGFQLEASGTGFACGDDRVTLRWDGTTTLGDGPSGTFSVSVTIPADASISQHTVVASCRNHPEITDSQSFTVTTDAVNAAVPPMLALTPARGAPTDTVHVTGDQFACNDSRPIALSWDGEIIGNPLVDTSGHFDTTFSVRADARAGSHTVRAACAAGSAVATAGFTVVNGTISPTTTANGPNPPPPPPSPPKFNWLVLVIVGVLATVIYHRWRKSRPAPPHHVYARVSTSSPLPLLSTRETPAHGELNHAVRLQVHADLGTQTIREVDSDHTTR